MLTAVYLRISEDREGRELGIERQRRDCLALAARRGWNVAEVYVDNDRGASTRSRKARPAYARMLADAGAGRFGAIIAYSSSRLTRRPREHEDLIDLALSRRIRYEYVASPSFDLNTAAGREVARILAAKDTGEAEEIAERVQRETLDRAERGAHHGGPRAYGYTADGMALVPDEAEQLEHAYRATLAGASIASVARAIGRNHSSVRVILRNPRNAGLRVLHGVEYPGGWPAVVEPETWRAVVALLDDPARSTHTTSARKWLGSGLYVCERCAATGRATIGSTYSGEANGARRIYKCQPLRGGCARSWDGERLDAYIDLVVRERLALGDLADLLPVDRPDLDALRDERSKKRRRLDALAAEWAKDDDADPAQLRIASAPLQARVKEIDAALVEASASAGLDEVLTADDPVAAWDAIPVEQVDRRQRIVRRLMTITLGPSPRGRAPYRPELFVDIDNPRRP